MNKFSTKKLARAGIIAALYIALTYAFAWASFGPYQARISEALTILPLFYVEAVPALFIGCILGNLVSPLGAWDLLLGSLATLIAALATYFIGRTKLNKHVKIWLGILPPIISNALIVPIVLSIYGVTEFAYPIQALWIALGEVSVLATLGVALYYSVDNMREKKIGVMLD